MGFSFGDIFKPIQKVVSQVLPVVATGGLSLVSKDIKKAVTPITNPLSTLLVPDPKTALGLAASVVTKNPAVGGAAVGLDLSTLLGGPNASQALRTVTSAITPSMGAVANVLNIAGQVAGAFKPTLPSPTSPMVPMTAGTMQRVGGALARAGAAVSRRFRDKFPNLAADMDRLKERGMKVKRSQLWSLMRRFGGEILITAGLLTAAGVTELMMAGPGRRRMNPANVHALRRSMRRLEGFHRLCVQADKLRRPRSRKQSGRGSAPQFVRQG